MSDLNLNADPQPTGDAPQLVFSGAGDAAAAPVVEAAPVVIRGKLDRFGTAWGTGRRKTSVARVRVSAGKGGFTVNGRPHTEYFCVERDRMTIEQPLRAAEKLGAVDVAVTVEGGGTTGQAGAIVLGLARALEALNPTLHRMLGEQGFLTRDSRMVERKKYGYKKARRSFQFSKR
jgi:small subunit ribosomal protein S9